MCMCMLLALLTVPLACSPQRSSCFRGYAPSRLARSSTQQVAPPQAAALPSCSDHRRCGSDPAVWTAARRGGTQSADAHVTRVST
eukprot:8591102-Pyramimonas_sp.AAC.1